jgi:hypothetical protein
MTMPNTLAALPSNQYATLLSLVLGKKAFFATIASDDARLSTLAEMVETCCGA